VKHINKKLISKNKNKLKMYGIKLGKLNN